MHELQKNWIEKRIILKLNEEVSNAKEPQDDIALVKKYENLLKGTNKKKYKHWWKTRRNLKTL